jgi:hypothetical protein
MKNIKLNIIYLISFLFIVSCDSTNLDLRDDPNGAAPSDADIALLLNGAMTNFIDFNESATDFGMQVTRMTQMSGPVYDNAYAPTSFNTLWSNAYAGVLADTKTVIANGTDASLFEHVAVAKILQSYTLTTLVDTFGDVPYSEAISFTGNLNPKLDDGAEVYTAALELLTEAIIDLGKTSLKDLNSDDDIFYGGSTAKWTTLAKTLQLRIYNNMRLSNPNTAAINALIADGDLILNADEAFEIEYGTSDNDPDQRHFKFEDSYLGSGGEYMATYFMNLLKNIKSVEDPRLRYYIYRQTLDYPDPTTAEGLFTLPCLGESKPNHFAFNDPFCNVGDGYWGRDHGDAAGGPPDTDKISTWGLYPAGGKYDDSQGTPAADSDGAKGAGIHPIWNAASTKFLLAESALLLGTTGNALTLLEEGILASIDKVTSFNVDAIPTDATIPDATDITAYIDEVKSNYTAAASDTDKLNIIITESFISNWGNGIEVYNAYRRTSMPNNMQPVKSATPGKFIRSFLYPGNLVNLNSNVSSKVDNDVRVFWDLNPDTIE